MNTLSRTYLGAKPGAGTTDGQDVLEESGRDGTEPATHQRREAILGDEDLIYVAGCRQARLYAITDLSENVVTSEAYDVRWLTR